MLWGGGSGEIIDFFFQGEYKLIFSCPKFSVTKSVTNDTQPSHYKKCCKALKCFSCLFNSLRLFSLPFPLKDPRQNVSQNKQATIKICKSCK